MVVFPLATGHQMVNAPPIVFDLWSGRLDQETQQRQPSHLQGRPQRAVILCTKASGSLRPQWWWRAHPAEPIPGTMPGPAFVPALCRDRGGFVTWPLSSTQPRNLHCPPFALRTEVQPCPGHRLAVPFSVCQSIKTQLPLWTHQLHGKEKRNPHHSNYLSWPELQVTFPRSTEVADGSTLVCRIFSPLCPFTKHIFFSMTWTSFAKFSFAKRSLGGLWDHNKGGTLACLEHRLDVKEVIQK